MSNVVCYQYKREVSDGRNPEVEWFTSRQMEGKTEYGHYLFENLAVVHTPIAAWKIKRPFDFFSELNKLTMEVEKARPF